MNQYDSRRMASQSRRLEELRLWRNAREQHIGEWWCAAGDGEPRKVSTGERWPVVDVPVRFWTEAEIPEAWTGEPVELELWLGGEGLVRTSTGTVGGLDPFHRSFAVTGSARGGERVRVEAEVVPKGMSGAHVPEPHLVRACLVVPGREVRALERDLSVVLDACTVLDDHEVVPRLLDVLEAATGALSAGWPTATGVTLTRYLESYVDRLDESDHTLPPGYAEKASDISRSTEPWNHPETPSPLEPLPEEARRAVHEARGIVAARLEEIRDEYPPVGRLALTGHAHLDLAWLWPVAETRRKARRTFASVLGLMDRYEDFTFNQSSAQMYAWVEEDDPKTFARIRERVREGRWEPVGGAWVEPDCQIPGGESSVRQLLYGQRYFQEKFGQRATVAWLPDTFGFSPAIPQLLRGAGISGFFTYKLNWSETNEFPHDLFEWEGLDGSRVKAHTFDNPGVDYNGDVTPHDLFGTWRNFKGKRHHRESLFSFGWGDGGGGPSEKMLENYSRLAEFPALPRLRMARVDEFFAALPEEGLPVWVGELYLELHRGTLTTQGRIKKLNRQAEHRLLEAEAFAALASLENAPYPHRELEGAWKTLLLNQFHDILPGSSIAEVYEEAVPQLEGVVKTAEKLRDVALRHLAGVGTTDAAEAVIVANAALHPRPLSVILPNHDGADGLLDAGGNRLPVQETEEGLLVHAPGHWVPALGAIVLHRSGEGATQEPGSGVRLESQGSGAVLESDLLLVEIGDRGDLERVYDKTAGREVLDGRGNRLWAYVDKPRAWDAWDIDEGYEAGGEEVTGAEGVEIVEEGPLRGAVRVERRWRGSRIAQTYRLLAGSRRLDIATHIDWHERQVLLRALFPLNVRSHEATFETMYGVVKRPTHRNTSWDTVRFEVCAHRFADLSETGYGVALLNDSRYGHSARDNVLGISLLRSPLYPDPRADEGEHQFIYSLFPHHGGWVAGGVAEEALDLNSPLCGVDLPEGRGSRPNGGLVELEGTKLALGSLKMAEDGDALILRLYEPHGARGMCALRFARGVKKAGRTDLLEEHVEELVVQGWEIRLSVRPFEVVTLRVELEEE